MTSGEFQRSPNRMREWTIRMASAQSIELQLETKRVSNSRWKKQSFLESQQFELLDCRLLVKAAIQPRLWLLSRPSKAITPKPSLRILHTTAQTMWNLQSHTNCWKVDTVTETDCSWCSFVKPECQSESQKKHDLVETAPISRDISSLSTIVSSITRQF
jgi:hypothetical protein